MQDISFDQENSRKDFDELVEECLANNDHFSLYLFPFANRCQVNTWNRREKARTVFERFREFVEISKGDLLEFISISKDALTAAWIGNFVAYIGQLPGSRFVYSFKPGSTLLLESNKGYNRTIYHYIKS